MQRTRVFEGDFSTIIDILFDDYFEIFETIDEWLLGRSGYKMEGGLKKREFSCL